MIKKILCRLTGHKMVWAFAYPNFEKRIYSVDTTDTRRKDD